MLQVLSVGGHQLAECRPSAFTANHQPSQPIISLHSIQHNPPTHHRADALGGNSLTLFIGTLRQGEWEASATTLRQLATARSARNFPIINHSRARGLLHKLRFRLLNVMVRRSGGRARG